MQKKTYYIKSNKIKEKKKLFLFSDVHFKDGFPIKKLTQILMQAELAEPDYICIAGDLVDDAKWLGDVYLLSAFLDNLSKIAPIIMGFGNHDLLTRKAGNWVYYVNEDYFEMLLKKPKLHLLDNRGFKDKDIEFTGITMPYDYYEKCHESLEYTKIYMDSIADSILDKQEPDLYQVLLFHSPISILELTKRQELNCLKNTDLILSGHLHGGLTPPLFEFFLGHRGIVGPTNLAERTICPKYARGHIKFQDSDAVVSTGISKLNIPKVDMVLPPNINEIIIDKPKVLTKK